MDVLRFINSNAIRNHLKEIDYRFSALEAAWLVYQCKDATLHEKHAAWQEIVDTMPNEQVDQRKWKIHPDLHEVLRQYMRMENTWLDRFHNDGDAVYRFAVCNRDNTIRGYGYMLSVFSDLDKCKAGIDKFLCEENDDNEFITVRIRKYLLNSSQFYQLAVSAKGDIMSIHPVRIDDEYTDIRDAFEDLWFAFPTPFQKGDIVYDPFNPYTSCGLCSGPLVLNETATDYYNRTGKRLSDSSDMVAWGIFQRDDGGVYGECMHDYMNLEYYPGERLTGKKRVLKAFSNFMKDKIDAELLARAYHAIRAEEYAKDCVPKDYTSEGLRLAGLKEE